VYFLYCLCIAVLFCTLDAGLLARIQYSEGPATGHLDTGFSWFPCVYKQMLRWFPRFKVATTCFSCSPPDLNLVVINFMFCLHVKQPLPPSNNPIAVNKYIIIYYIINFFTSWWATDLETCRGMKKNLLWNKFCASSLLNTEINVKYYYNSRARLRWEKSTKNIV